MKCSGRRHRWECSIVDDSREVREIPHPKDDPRSVSELITAILSGPDENVAWDAIGALQWRGTREGLDRAAQLCQSFCTVERSVGAEILGQLGIPVRTLPKACVHILLSMLETERDPIVLRSVLVALSHQCMPEAIVPASRLRNHADPNVRHA